MKIIFEFSLKMNSLLFCMIFVLYNFIFQVARNFIKADEFQVDDFRVVEERHIMFAIAAK